MAFDEELADRVRSVLCDVPGVTERKMFGGIAFMVSGHMACGIVGDDLMLRLGEDGAATARSQPHVRPMDVTGRPMKSMVFIEPVGIARQQDLAEWVGRSVAHAASLPPT